MSRKYNFFLFIFIGIYYKLYKVVCVHTDIKLYSPYWLPQNPQIVQKYKLNRSETGLYLSSSGIFIF